MLDINQAILKMKEQLSNSAPLVDFKINITQNEEVNTNINYTPWLGIYTQKVSHNPQTLATTQRRWKGTITLVLVIQATSLSSGEDCGILLEKYITEVVSAVINDTTFGSSIDMVNKLDIEYSYDKKESSTLHFQSAFITLEVESEHEK